MDMTVIQTWATVLLILVGAGSLGVIFAAPRSEWKKLFDGVTVEKREEKDDA